MNSYPILRLAIFMAAGIFFGEKYSGYCSPENLYLILGVLILILGLGVVRTSYRMRWLFGVAVSCAMFLVGWFLVEQEWREVKTVWSSEKQLYRASILETPIEKSKSIQCRVEVNDKEVQLYLFKDSLSSALRIGDELWLYTQIQSPKNSGNPYEFDYAGYLYHHGVSGTAYAHSGYWVKKNSEHKISLKQKALLFREKLVKQFREWGMDERQLPIVTALTLGCKKDLDENIRDIYATAGISHVLALSGMHVGIVWLILDLLLKPIVFIRKGRWVKWLLSTACLWMFAFVVGLEASVVRAVVMCMLMELAKLSGGKALSLNTLAIAAVAMMFYNPFYLYDVGFQLSYAAVASIALFYPLINRKFDWRSRFWRYVGGIISVSVAAQLGTAPLVMYYFSNFSVYFLLANLFAAVLVPFIIGGTLVMILVSPFQVLLDWSMSVLTKAVDVLTMIATHVSGLPGATFSLSSISGLEIGLFYALLMIILLYATKARRALFIKGLGICVCLLAVHLYNMYPKEQGAEIVFYHVKNCPAVHFIESDGTSYLFSEKGDTASVVIQKVAYRFWSKERIKSPLIVHDDTNGFGGLFQENIISWHGKMIGVFSDNRWKNKITEDTLKLDYIYICDGFEQNIAALLPLFQVDKIIIDASLSRSRAESLKKECRELGIDCVDIASEGSLRIFL